MWLIIHHIEQEVALSTARPSRMEHVSGHDLRSFLNHRVSVSTDVRTLSAVEIVQLRGQCYPQSENRLVDLIFLRLAIERDCDI